MPVYQGTYDHAAKVNYGLVVLPGGFDDERTANHRQGFFLSFSSCSDTTVYQIFEIWHISCIYSLYVLDCIWRSMMVFRACCN